MKKLILIMLFNCGCLYSFAQSAVTESEAKTIIASLMASFTEKTSFAYSKGISLERFKANLLIRPTAITEGNAYCVFRFNRYTRNTYLDRGKRNKEVGAGTRHDRRVGNPGEWYGVHRQCRIWIR